MLESINTSLLASKTGHGRYRNNMTPEGSQLVGQERPPAATTLKGSQPEFHVSDRSGTPQGCIQPEECLGANSMLSGNYISQHDALISEMLGYVMCGGDLSEATEVSEQYL